MMLNVAAARKLSTSAAMLLGMAKPSTARATVRQSADQADALIQVAQVDGMSAAEAVRVAVARYIQARHADPVFQARLRERIQADQDVLHRAERQPG